MLAKLVNYRGWPATPSLFQSPQSRKSMRSLCVAIMVVTTACTGQNNKPGNADPSDISAPGETRETSAPAALRESTPDLWPALTTPPLNPEVETRVEEILAKLSLEQKIGQVIQADSGSVTPEEVKQYRLGSVLSGGNSAPGGRPYADVDSWLEAVDAAYMASIDPEGVEIAVPILWGIDAVHGHNNVIGGTLFPHNIGLGAANNPELIKRIAQVTATELVVTGHDWTFAPTLAVPQNDRWGRAYEGFSESPEIVASYGGKIVEGLQGIAGSQEFMGAANVISSAKHFIGDGGTDNGIDQGNTITSEKNLVDIHNAGYVTALEAGAQSVMASFSSWNGAAMHGNKYLLTDVLKDRMNFNGFVVGDWNGHALIPGCTKTDCPQALNAGLDMYMAPDSWKGLWESTYAHVQSGKISMERLDDAVRRILRAKVASGVFEKGRPNQRPLAGDRTMLGTKDHRAVARQAVRESLVLLKNNGQLLPLSPSAKILVIGDGADNISKTAGGWTLSWQGTGHPNDLFPNGQTVLDAIKQIVNNAGGEVIFDPKGETQTDAEIVIAVYGENPYAEFQGDRNHVDFQPNDFDPQLLKKYRASGAKTVSVFLSGRPLWTNPEINASDAFIAAWLPGSEGGGIADLLFRTNPDYDFTGRLSFSWPILATQAALNARDFVYDPLFGLGYGLTYTSATNLGELSEDPGDITNGSDGDNFFMQGEAVAPWTLMANSTQVPGLPFSSDGLTIAKLDKDAQEDSLRIDFEKADSRFALATTAAVNLSRQANGALELVFDAKSFSEKQTIQLGMGCSQSGSDLCETFIPITINSEWGTIRRSLSCFAPEIVMSSVDRIVILKGAAGQSVGLANIRLDTDLDGQETCE